MQQRMRESSSAVRACGAQTPVPRHLPSWEGQAPASDRRRATTPAVGGDRMSCLRMHEAGERLAALTSEGGCPVPSITSVLLARAPQRCVHRDRPPLQARSSRGPGLSVETEPGSLFRFRRRSIAARVRSPVAGSWGRSCIPTPVGRSVPLCMLFRSASSRTSEQHVDRDDRNN